ncbi:hypothetical protein MNB_SUP05-12-783 [hydrothermal vent metagenome]|uniref:Uncharacterized protein n=1 Tax=hydrothermal vent metagenome TaxID=652676 RepID=A0A1W1DF24_9ZZZZ
MKKLLSLLLILFLTAPVCANEKMSKSDLLKYWDGKVITMTNKWNALISFEVSNGEVFYIKNEDGHNTESKNKDVWIRDNGKLCFEYYNTDDCQEIIKTFDGDFTFKTRVLTLSDSVDEAMALRTTNNKPHIKLATGCSQSTKGTKTLKNRVVGEINYKFGKAYASCEITPFTGKFINYYDNGDKKSEITYKNGRQFDLTVTYFENRNKNLESYWNNGDKTSEIKYYNNFLNFKNHKTTFHTGQYSGSYYRPSTVSHYMRYYKSVPLIILIIYGGMLCIRRKNTDYFIKWLASLSAVIVLQSFAGVLLDSPNPDLDYGIPMYYFFIPYFFTVNTPFFIALYLFFFYSYATSILNTKSTKYLTLIPVLITFISWIGVIGMYISAFG